MRETRRLIIYGLYTDITAGTCLFAAGAACIVRIVSYGIVLLSLLGETSSVSAHCLAMIYHHP